MKTKKTTEELTKDEKSLLLFLENAYVEHAGVYDPRCINDCDRAIMDRWKSDGIIDHGRVAFDDVTPKRAAWCKLSAATMDVAHKLRTERAERMWTARKWRTTAEKRVSA